MPIIFVEPSEEFLRIAVGQAAVYRQYAALAVTAATASGDDFGLGGKLVFAGDLAQNSELLRAANITGAASLAASEDTAVQRSAMRDGVVDFLVTSLDEALRILKNEIRKRQPVSVSVGVAPDVLAEQMLERGVLPDLLGTSACDGGSLRRFREQGGRSLKTMLFTEGSYVGWAVNQAGGKWLQQMDGCAAELVPARDTARGRWLRLAPRYMGRAAQRQHGVMLGTSETERFQTRVEELAANWGTGASEPVTLMLAGVDAAI
jgi:hypothetical protein